MSQSKFWMVLGAGVPTYRHKTKMSAFEEAERLARLHVGQEFTVLEALAACKKSDVIWEEIVNPEAEDNKFCGVPF